MSPSDDDERFLEDIAAYLDPLLTDWSPSDDADALSRAPDAGAPVISQNHQHQQQKQQNPMPATKPSVRNVTRERRQRELKELRAQCVELERQLAELQRKQVQWAQKTPTQQLLLASWKKITQRQLVMRAEAERENERLREKVAQHAAVAYDLQASMGLWATSESSLAPPSADTVAAASRAAAAAGVAAQPPPAADPAKPTHVAMQPLTHIDASDVEAFKQLLTEVDNEYQRMDQVLAENGLIHWRVDSRTTTAQMKARPGRPATLYIEQLEADVLPFDMETVFRACWQCWQRRNLPRSSTLYENLSMVDDGGGTVLSKLRYEVVVGGESIALDYVCVVRAYVESNRMSYVMRGFTKADSHFPGIYIDETDWQLVKPLGDRGDGARPLATATYSCSHMEAKKFPDESGQDLNVEHASPLASLTVTTYEVDMEELNSMMMNALLDDVNGRRHLSADPKVAYVRQLR